MIDTLAGRQKTPWSIEERDRAQKALRDHCDTRFKPVVSQTMLAVQTQKNALADGAH